MLPVFKVMLSVNCETLPCFVNTLTLVHEHCNQTFSYKFTNCQVCWFFTFFFAVSKRRTQYCFETIFADCKEVRIGEDGLLGRRGTVQADLCVFDYLHVRHNHVVCPPVVSHTFNRTRGSLDWDVSLHAITCKSTVVAIWFADKVFRSLSVEYRVWGNTYW